MKIILSRKSMDSQYGGMPSPVMDSDEGQRFFPLPIPYVQSNVHYTELRLYDAFSVWDFMMDVLPRYKDVTTCHLDPDLRRESIFNRNPHWQPAFGQMAGSQTHLERFGIGNGDVFLFFGWFQFAERQGERFHYVKTADYPNGFHAIYGYLQVGEVLKPNVQSVPSSLAYHPHVVNKGIGSFKTPNNTVYASAKFFENTHREINRSGAGLFPFHPELILTKHGEQKRTVWELPPFFHPDSGVVLTYHPPHKWEHGTDKALLKSAAQGQEFVFAQDPCGAVAAWCTGLIERFGLKP